MTTTFAKARLVNTVCRTDFTSFSRKCFHTSNPGTPFYSAPYWRALGYSLDQVRRGAIKRLIVNMPPRFGKSLAASIALPAFVLGHDPTKRIVAITYSLDHAAKQHGDFRAIVESSWYQDLFPAMRINRSTELETTTVQRGYRRATSTDAMLTGIGGDILIIDDYLKQGEAGSDNKRTAANNSLHNAIVTRLDNKQTGAVVVVGHRLHIDDLTALLLRSGDEWTLLNLPAIAEQEQRIPISDTQCYTRSVGDLLNPDLLPADHLRVTRKSNPETYAAEFQQNPLPPGGPVIKPDWIQSYDELPKKTEASRIIQSWDPAWKPGETNARSACTTWLFQENRRYLLDLAVGQFHYLTLKERAIDLNATYKPAVILVEDTLMGTPLVEELQRLGLPAKPVKAPTKDKLSRLCKQIPKFTNGQVFFPRNKPWRAEVESELFAFPYGRFTDIVDSISQALDHELVIRDYGKAADGMERFISGLAFHQMFRGRII